MQILDYVLKMTCGACPEQYDVFDSEGKQVGYLRLRHGGFRADYPNCGGDTVYRCSFDDGWKDTSKTGTLGKDTDRSVLEKKIVL